MWDIFGQFHRNYVVEPTSDYIVDKIGDVASGVGHSVWDWFVQAIPDIAGYGTMASGIFIVLGSMVGRGGILKPLAYLAGGLIVAVCVLEAA